MNNEHFAKNKESKPKDKESKPKEEDLKSTGKHSNHSKRSHTPVGPMTGYVKRSAKYCSKQALPK